jgi:hypothetical protein
MVKASLASAALLVGLANAACECGYTTNTGETWQYKVETDFSKLTAADWQNTSDWAISNITREATVHLAYTPNNVALVNGTLQLTCSAYNASVGGGIKAGQIRTTRRDILYGSFRASYTVVSKSAGSVAGFFFYANDTQEIDIEIQSKMNNQTIHIGNQPTQNDDIYLPNNGVVSQMHNYRFDWLKNETKFYLDSVPAGGFAKDVPVVNGSISFNMWGNGGSFSGPMTPTTDNIMSISKISLYFNTSSKTDAGKWETACRAQKKKRPVCKIDQRGLSANTTTSTDDETSAGCSHRMKGKWGKGKFCKLKNIVSVGVGAAFFNF